MTKGLQCHSCEERLREQGLSSIDKRRLRGILPMCENPSCGVDEEDGDELFSVLPSDWTRGNENKAKYRKFHLKARKTSLKYTMRDCHNKILTNTQ